MYFIHLRYIYIIKGFDNLKKFLGHKWKYWNRFPSINDGDKSLTDLANTYSLSVPELKCLSTGAYIVFWFVGVGAIPLFAFWLLFVSLSYFFSQNILPWNHSGTLYWVDIQSCVVCDDSLYLFICNIWPKTLFPHAGAFFISNRTWINVESWMVQWHAEFPIVCQISDTLDILLSLICCNSVIVLKRCTYSVIMKVEWNTWEQYNIYNLPVGCESWDKVEISRATTPTCRTGLHQELSEPGLPTEIQSLSLDQYATNGIYLEALGTCRSCNMLQHVLLFELLTWHTHSPPVTHLQENRQLASVYLVYFLKYWLVSEVLRE